MSCTLLERIRSLAFEIATYYIFIKKNSFVQDAQQAAQMEGEVSCQDCSHPTAPIEFYSHDALHCLLHSSYVMLEARKHAALQENLEHALHQQATSRSSVEK
jgi:hypothetical protein